MLDMLEDFRGISERRKQVHITFLGGGFINIFHVHTKNCGRFPIWRAYFSDGWRKTTNYIVLSQVCRAAKMKAIGFLVAGTHKRKV